jgi:hypothetical protein
LQLALREAIGEKQVRSVALEWQVPEQMLRDILSGKIVCPSAKYLRQVARGLGWATDDVIAAAYSEPTPA